MFLETTNDNINHILILVFTNDEAFANFKSRLSKTSEEHVAIVNASSHSSAIVDRR